MTGQEQRTIRVIYSGRVQGVGFRATTHAIAQRYDVVGYVRNQADGTVELIAGGSKEEIQNFLDAVSHRFRGHISNTQVEPIKLEEDFDSFDIRH